MLGINVKIERLLPEGASPGVPALSHAPHAVALHVVPEAVQVVAVVSRVVLQAVPWPWPWPWTP